MIRVIVLALLASAATVTGELGTREVLVYSETRSTAVAGKATETRKTHEINVPRIKNGAVKGYAVMLLTYTVDLGALKKAAMAPTRSWPTKPSATSMTTTRSTSTIWTASTSPR